MIRYIRMFNLCNVSVWNLWHGRNRTGFEQNMQIASSRRDLVQEGEIHTLIVFNEKF